MNKLLLLVCLFASLCANGQEPGFFYFDKNDRLVANQEDASKRKEIRPVSDKQFEIIEAVKTSTGWTENGKKEIVNRKKDKFYITRNISLGGFNSSLSVIDTLAEGFLIREYFEGFCFREAEVKLIFPLVLNGKCTIFPKTKRDKEVISYYRNNMEYTEFPQPAATGTDSVLTASLIKPDFWPKYPGGSRQFYDDINRLIRKKNYRVRQLSGVVWISATVNTLGNTEQIHVVKSLHPTIDTLLVDCILNLDTPWLPASIDGKAVNYTYSLPFDFFAKEKKPQAPEKVLMTAERMPVYPGGEQALREEIAMNIRYPVEAQKQKIQGKVFVNFVVDKEGKIRNARIAKGVDPRANASKLITNQS